MVFSAKIQYLVPSVLFRIALLYTVKLGYNELSYNELSYNEHSVITNKYLGKILVILVHKLTRL